MGKYKQYKRGLSAWISSEKGQRFFNFAYSIGAAIVIWGALFKILHLPGGNFLLSLGMGTEVLMFTLTAFDRPPRDYKWENVFPVFETGDPDDRPDFKAGTGVVINGGVNAAGGVAPQAGPVQAPVLSSDSTPAEVVSSMVSATQTYLDQVSAMAEELRHLQETTRSLNNVSDVLLESYRAITENSENITRSSTGYVEQMQGLNRNIQGLNTIYEIQLKSVSSQLDAIDRVNAGIKEIRDMYERSSSQSARYCEETEKMALYMHQLNSVYEKMINAMTINMYAANPLAAAAAAQGAAQAVPVTPEPAQAPEAPSQPQAAPAQAVPPQYQGAPRRPSSPQA
ncbi:MAG: gliding motility protein GldL [Muribaculaceae bacterium]|nr:gliding motility protein GldL [Muribaculaceae bacterium]